MKNFEPDRPLRWRVVNNYYNSLALTFPTYHLSFLDIRIRIMTRRGGVFEGGVDASGNHIPTRIPTTSIKGVDWCLYAYREGQLENLILFREEANTLTEILEMFEQEILPYLRDYARALLEETL